MERYNTNYDYLFLEMSLINKLVSLYILLNYLTYMMSAIVSNHFIINNISQAIKVDIIYDNRETTDKVSSLLPTTGTAEVFIKYLKRNNFLL